MKQLSLILTLHYSRVVPRKDGRRYLPSTAILLVEGVKMVISLSVTSSQMSKTYPSWSVVQLWKQQLRSIFSRDSWKLVILALLWSLQNSIVYIAISNLDAATFQVTYQLKIPSTVLLSIVFLKKRVSAKQWLALVLLVIGVAIVQPSGSFFQVSTTSGNMQSNLSAALKRRDWFATHSTTVSNGLSDLVKQPGPRPALREGMAGPIMDTSRGISALLAACMISGIAGVYFEKVLKDTLSSVTVWTRNAQLSFYSIFPVLAISVLWQDGKEISRDGFFVGYSPLVWLTIFLQAAGGIIVAICITYADNIQKNFAMSLSVIISTLATSLLFDKPLTLNASETPFLGFTLGTSLVLLAVYLYQPH
ncbi:nucleotide-sugar transporter-domain-containing protein [Cadophora sp. MPI-SDFR-AT-0126]|nr:nucleotide-sugar transporter-domain-containing protein [Leotiomycetes sp. MPI-SDFR-AT-0126]